MKLPLLSTVVGAVLLATSPAVGQVTATATTPQGKLAGRMLGNGTRVFLGIPYALPPIGKARWRPPVRAAAWSGVRNATAFGAACMQPKSRPASIYADDPPAMSEDCLSLNVWAPKGSRRAPVMVWIHGGSMLTGYSGSPFYDGARLAEKGVVVVTINYRLGVFGFLAHPGLSAESPHNVSGNYGLLDQIEALKWVRRNIAALGGDPRNVTIFGESAGALSTMYLLSSPLARGLYNKAIAESPYMVPTPLLRSGAYGMPSGEQIGLTVGAKLNAPDIKALRAVDAATLNALPIQGGPVPQATIDGWSLTRQLVDTFDAGEQARVPIMAGFNSGEIRSLRGLAPPVPTSAAAYQTAIRAVYGDLADRYLELYPASDLEDNILAATRDAIYGWSAQRLVATQARLGIPSYLYFFDHRSPAADALNLGAFHASEIPFVFGAAGTNAPLPVNWPKPPVNAAEKGLSAAMVSYWTSFARRGIPTAPGQPAWRPFGKTPAYMAFRAKPEASVRLLPGHYALVEEVTCRRRAANQSWIAMIGSAPPNIPTTPCASKSRARP
jgi:para-nitrobenzyl esterase